MRRGSVKNRISWILILSLGLLSVAPFLTVEGIYLSGLSLMHRLPSPPQREPWPLLARAAIWVHFQERGPISVKPIRSWDILSSLVRQDGYVTPGYILTNYVAVVLFSKEDLPQRMLIRHLKKFSLAVWLSRNWTTEQIIMEAGRLMPVVTGLDGVEKDSIEFFGKKIDELKNSEITLILAIARFRRMEEAGKRPEELLARRNHIIETMFRNGFISEADMQKAITQPIKFRREIGRAK